DGSSATNPDSASTVMFINFEDTTSIICGFTIQGGAGLISPTGDIKYGGGVACWESGPKIQHNIIKDNTITDSTLVCGGVGIGSYSETGNWWMVIDSCEISDNVCVANAEYTLGGGICIMTNVIIRYNTIKNNSCFNDGAETHGGGIEVYQPVGVSIIAEIHDNLIQYNIVEGNMPIGAGIIMSYAGGYIINNVISDNEAIGEESACGAGIMLNMASATISNNEISNNSCVAETMAKGGGIYTNYAGELHILNNLIINNSCEANKAWAAGYYCDNTNGNLYITGNEFIYNQMTGIEYWFGAGITINDFSNLIHIKDNLFDNNWGNDVSEWSLGGALEIYSTSDEEVITESNIFSNNYAERGAAIWTFGLSNHKIQNNVFSGNSAELWGGGLFLHQYFGKNLDKELTALFMNEVSARTKELSSLHPLIINNTFFNNHAGELGGAIYTTSAYDSICPVILNNIFWDNTANIAGNDIRHGGDEAIYVGYNDIDTNGILGNWTGENNIYEDPLFVDPQNGNFHIDVNSPCAGSGIDSLDVNGSMFCCPSIDFENDPRPWPFTLMPDMGVDEIDEINPGYPEFRETNNHSLILKNYPNPFRNQTTIELNITQSDFATLSVVDFTGKEIRCMISENLSAGTHQFDWKPGGLPPGIYFMRFQTNGIAETRKLLLIK
ncbi:MAG: right-handed parallel beta-helix repeat-containing protein, partial [Bacteroidales bacterium]|nr:right-handed parallel beta-helix repeat-containing protein [Bacteroidales bacterium]